MKLTTAMDSPILASKATPTALAHTPPLCGISHGAGRLAGDERPREKGRAAREGLRRGRSNSQHLRKVYFCDAPHAPLLAMALRLVVCLETHIEIKIAKPSLIFVL